MQCQFVLCFRIPGFAWKLYCDCTEWLGRKLFGKSVQINFKATFVDILSSYSNLNVYLLNFLNSSMSVHYTHVALCWLHICLVYCLNNRTYSVGGQSYTSPDKEIVASWKTCLTVENGHNCVVLVIVFNSTRSAIINKLQSAFWLCRKHRRLSPNAQLTHVQYLNRTHLRGSCTIYVARLSTSNH
jgi:hypothetical protein